MKAFDFGWTPGDDGGGSGEGTMAELINLRQFKKRKNRRIKDDAAERNRAKFGRAKADRKAAGAEADKLRRDLDGKKRED